MGKLTMQVQVSVDGFMARPDGDTGWMLWNWGDTWAWDQQLKADFASMFDTVDCILLSRVLAQGGFVSHWEQAARDPSDARHEYATRVNNKRKAVFTNELDTSEWPNTEISSGDLEDSIMRLKEREGSLIVYGGARLVASLAAAELIDEFQFFINPIAIGTGMSPLSGNPALHLALVSSKPYECGIVIDTYVPRS
jgi:dihydrofolate reductase